MGMLGRELARSIHSSLGRFLALAGIVALGCGFYAGLSMCGPDMRRSADALYVGTSLADIRLVSTMGFSEEQLSQVRSVEGVEAASGGWSCDVMARMDGERYATRILSFDVDAASASEASDDGITVTSDDDSYLNRLVLVDGRWPTSPDECLLSADSASEGMSIGDTVTVLYGTSDLDGVLVTRTFTVVGFAHSPRFPDKAALGYTSLGSGELDRVMFVPEGSFADGLPHTELFVKVRGADELFYGSEEYEQKVGEVEDRLGAISDDLSASRLAEVRADAQDEVDEGWASYEDAKAEADQQLADAKAELDAALARLESSEAELESGRERLSAGYASLAEARGDAERRLAAARSALDDAQAKLDANASQLDASQAQADAGRQQLAQVQASLDELAQVPSALVQLDQAEASLDSLEAQRAQLEELAATQAGDELAQTQARIAQTDAAIAQLPSREDIASQRSRLEGALGQAGLTDASQVDAYVAAAREGLASRQAELDAADASIASGRDALTQGQSELDASRQAYESQAASARAQLDDAKATLDEKAAELSSGEDELASGWAGYEDGLATYQSSKADAESRLSDAAAQLEAAQADVDALEVPDVYVLDRSQNTGISSYADDAGRIDSIASVFPLIFFLVAALVALTTMTRMVEDDRVDIGTHKALGFSAAAIASRYVAYALIASGVGAVAGIAILSQVLPYIVHSAYGIMYNVPQEPMPLAVDMGIACGSALAGVGITLCATWLAAAQTMREAPATLMLPKAPKPGKRILLERVGPVWQRMSFSWKVTMRNLFRYKRRLAMTVVGIAGCTALLLTGLGVRDSIWDIIEIQYEGANPIFSFNVVVGLDDGATSSQLSEVDEVLEDVGGAEGTCAVELDPMQASTTGRADATSIQVMVANDPSELTEFIDMRGRMSGEAVAFGDDSVVLTEKVASKLGVGVGDTFTVYDQDSIGNATGEGYQLTCTGITENYVYHYCYVGPEAWRKATGSVPADNAVLAMADSSDASRAKLDEALEGVGGVATVSFNSETVDSYRTSLKAVDMVMGILVVSAAALAFIVLYNLTNINIIERVREIASLKVLGFTPREVVAYVFREIVVLVVLGSAAGLVLGTWLEAFVVVSAETNPVMFGRAIHPASYLIAFGATLAFSLLVIAAMVPKLRRTDMVESLKSVD
ncbi:MAG: FtsX-like permease family protein [Atopobiaceae bacterium]|jgi:putative ABC transport system permease protein|nr:FtsX-like permease family protein [Atopobiaceae bacterium]MCH4120299.1 FtsX-like permease family protein [Atopobiaceae bacterium]MCI1318867.1 FtsX-like permease family protein [Atopobiaceae bacterium]MCI1389282.1 FtsX-like permease family protein [Atopobiaceae bacterium]MCI1432345.1 FtsX-like permease family protein [Atopobiaceae bacterium]